MKLITIFSGAAILAPMANPRLYPSCVDLPQPMKLRGALASQNGDTCSRGLPDSWVTIVLSRSTVCMMSHTTRYGFRGISLLVNRGIHSASQASFKAAILVRQFLIGRPSRHALGFQLINELPQRQLGVSQYRVFRSVILVDVIVALVK